MRKGPGTTSREALVADEFVIELRAMLVQLVARAPLFADLRRRGLADDVVQDALLAVTGRLAAGHQLDEPFAYARRCVVNLAKRAYLEAAREAAVGDDQMELLAPAVEDVADRVEQRAAMSEVLDMVRSVGPVIADLDPVSLELVRAELGRTDQSLLARRLGMSRPTLYRRKGPAIAAFVASVAQRAGTRPCPEHAGALLAAAGASGFRAAQAATEHATGCEQCGATIRHLEVARHGLAIIAPVPLVVEVAPGHRGVGWLERLHTAVDAALDAVRQAAVRAGDPTPLTGSAGKTAAIVAAACTGGSGVYCAIEGLPEPLRAPFAHHASPKPRASRAPASSRSARLTAVTTRPVSLPGGTALVNALAGAARVTLRKATAKRVAVQRQAARVRAARAREAATATRQEAAREFARRTATAAPPAAAAAEFAGPTTSTATTQVPGAREFSPTRTPVTSGNASAGQTAKEFAAP